MEQPKRKQNRLAQYNYSLPGCYFITICTKGKAHSLGTVGRSDPSGVGRDDPGAPRVQLSPYGRAVAQYIQSIEAAYENVLVETYVIMPNHVHLLLAVTGPGDGAPGSSRPTQLIPRVVAALKRFTNQACGQKLWQTSYHDHIIRTDADYLRIWDYIHNNPARWREDCYYTTTGG